MKHAEALALAEEALNALKPHCERILIAGSIRRLKPEVKDIEICAIPRMVPAGLFNDELEVDPDFCATVNQWPKVKGEPTGRYTQRRLPGGIALDLFIANPDNWGWILCLRTGSSDFNQKMLLHAMHQQEYTSDQGTLQREGQAIPTPEETDVFRLLKLPWAEPWAREVRDVS
jgi:DNA polymerase/3'-5' exonuclease PolX